MTTINLDILKNEYFGKQLNWLTVIDVIRDEGKIKFVCKCKCGNTFNVYYKKVLSVHTKSCGCYIHSEEYSKSQSQWCKIILIRYMKCKLTGQTL